MRILVACEFSQVVTKAFRDRGHEAYSCDLLPTEGNPEWHIQDDVLNHLDDGWDMMIAHPPCTYLSKAGARWLYSNGIINNERYEKGLRAKEFFIQLLDSPISRIAIENPTPLTIFEIPEPTQIIQPYYYGHPYSKRTLLWLKNLPFLLASLVMSDYETYTPSNTGGKKRNHKYHFVSINAKDASRTFEGVAKAMAEQWG